MTTNLFKTILICFFVAGILISCSEKKDDEKTQNKRTLPTTHQGQYEPQRATTTTTNKENLIGNLQLEKNTFKPNEVIRLTFKVNQKLVEKPWIGIIPSEIPHGDESKNDQHDVSYKYFDNQENGVLEFEAPKKAGKYDFRMHSSDNNGVEITSVSFEVKEKSTSDITGELSLERTMFIPGEKIMLTFKVNQKLDQHPWIGIIPSGIPHGDEAKNDMHDVSYKYFDNKENGTLEFTAPTKEGKYDFRMHSKDNNGVEITSISFEVAQ